MPTSKDDTVRAQIRRGDDLFKAAAMVGDLEDHRFWKMRRDRWALDTVEALSDMTSPAVLHTFERAVSSPAALGDIAEDLPLELEGLRRALAVLLGLQDGPADSHEAARPAP